MNLVRIIVLFCVILTTGVSPVCGEEQGESVLETQPNQVDSAILDTIFSGGETLHYAVSWSGGVKIGDIYMQIRAESAKDGVFVISAKVKDYGPLELFYPVDDRFTCLVSGPMKLPFRYDVHQKEGYGREIKRLTLYDQEKKTVQYRKNNNELEHFTVSGTVYNEFASFIITRALRFNQGEDIVVPTFADKKRHEVRVSVEERERIETVFGQLQTLKVQPKMHFKGLYDKNGDTVLWLTDDHCRVPVEIHSKIVIGSLVAELVDYSNPACPELRTHARK